MPQDNASTAPTPQAFKINLISFADVTAALAQGWRDFARAPLFGLFFGGIYAAGGILIYLLLYVYNIPWMILPIAVGFPLVGPFIAVGLYEVSRRLAAGRPLVWRDVLSVVLDQRKREVSWMAFIVLFVFWIWIYQIRLLLAIFLGFKSFSTMQSFITVVTGTAEGISFLLVGTVVGALLAFVLFCSTVIAIPLLLDRDTNFVEALITSFKSVFANLPAMIGFGIVVVVLTALALLPMFLGLLIVLPVLGHATWHLYRRVIA